MQSEPKGIAEPQTEDTALSGMSEEQHNLGVSETEFSLLKQEVGGIKESLQSLTSKIDIWMTARRSNVWQIVGLIGAFLIPLGFILNLYVSNTIRPVSEAATTAKTSSETALVGMARNTELLSTVVAQNADSRRDREDKQRAIDQLAISTNNLNVNLGAFVAGVTKALAEVETQIDATTQMLNIQWATQQRKDADFQNALHALGATMPPAPTGPWFFPNISTRKALPDMNGHSK